MTDREQQQAIALATLRADCPACGAELWWPVNTDALEAECDCGACLRLEPCGCVREVVCRGTVVDLEELP